MNNNTENRQLKKWVIQTIISVMLFSMLYMCEKYTSAPAVAVNNFREYALVHNTDFRYIWNNTTDTMITMVDMMFEAETAEVFNNTSTEEIPATQTTEPDITPSPSPAVPPATASEE